MAELLQTTLCYLEQNGCYLMLHRIKKKNDVNHDKWIGVGVKDRCCGKFDPGAKLPKPVPCAKCGRKPA